MIKFSPLYSCLVNSTLWKEDGNTIKIFVTLLSMARNDGVVFATEFEIARSANLTQPNTKYELIYLYNTGFIKSVDSCCWQIRNPEIYLEAAKKHRRLITQRNAIRKFRKKNATNRI
jgi:hypothetical protein